MSGLRSPTASSLRKLLEAVLRTASELDAFLCDHYPDVNRNLSNAMDRTQRVTKLLEARPTVDVLERLRESHPERVTQHERLLVEDSGRRILKDEFELYEIFHEGPMSRLYRAWQRSTKVWRAVKELKMPLRDERSRQRFMQEVEILAKLQSSQHIVRIIDADIDVDDRHTPWLAMELLVGESLAEYMARTGALSWDETYRLLADICNPLSLAHRQQPAIVHRDIKPENIFLQSVNKGSEQPSSPLYTVQLLDFGLAKVLWESRPALSSRGGIGTHPWMAPEQFDDEGLISPATDVWALGLLAFNLVSGLHYFPAGNKKKLVTAAMVAQIFREPLVPATERARQLGASVQLPAAFDRWFGKCVQLDASKRYATAGEAMSAFKAIVYRPLARSPSQPPVAEETAAPGPSPPPHRPELIDIPAGHFQMGSTPYEEPERWLDEAVRRVHIAQPFWLAQTPVTQGQYDKVMGLTPAYFKGDPRRPVESIGFLEALHYCNELSQREDLEPCYVFTANTVVLHSAAVPERAGYRLPTEEEWEYAARANQRHRYAGAGEPGQVAWYADNATAMTQPVGQKTPNGWQLFDMSGNVFEWVFTPYRATPSAGAASAPLQLTEELVVRGGAWSSSADMLRVSHRLAVPADCKTSYIGFRIARSIH